MIKDIVVNLSVREDGGNVGDYAVSVAEALDAHITGIAFVFDPIVPVSGTGYIPAEVIDTQLADNQTAAKAAIDRFAAATNARRIIGRAADAQRQRRRRRRPVRPASRGASILPSSARPNPMAARSKK